MLQEAIQSPFILKQLQQTSWENRDYIKNLLLLFRFMQKQRLSPPEGQHYFGLRNQYQEEYLHLLKEINPHNYHIYLEERERLQNHQANQLQMKLARRQQIIAEERQAYEQWQSLQQTAQSF